LHDLGAAVSLHDQLVDAAASHGNQGELRRDEEPVRENQQRHDSQPYFEAGVPQHISGRCLAHQCH
jgi:hypothetical protein